MASLAKRSKTKQYWKGIEWGQYSSGRSWVTLGMLITKVWDTTNVAHIMNTHMFIKQLKKKDLGKVCPDIYNFF